MKKYILDVGQCGPDHSTICNYLTKHFNCEITQSHGLEDTLEAIQSRPYDLVLINRKLDRDYSDGIEVLRQIKLSGQHADVPVMLVTNYTEHQEAAVAAGAVQGFGKLEFDDPATHQKISDVLNAESSR